MSCYTYKPNKNYARKKIDGVYRFFNYGSDITELIKIISSIDEIPHIDEDDVIKDDVLTLDGLNINNRYHVLSFLIKLIKDVLPKYENFVHTTHRTSNSCVLKSNFYWKCEDGICFKLATTNNYNINKLFKVEARAARLISMARKYIKSVNKKQSYNTKSARHSDK